MLLVETFINCTSERGVGLFSKKFIPKGTIYWIRNESFDSVFSKKVMATMEKLAINYIKKYGFLEKSGNWYLCNDNDRFSNHSLHPNSKNHFDENGIVKYCTTLCNIATGEEILCDYTEICQTCISGVDFIPLD